MFRQMEKLIELLNEYEKESKLKSEIFWEKSEFIVISKKFWFIKWLVENDKIDIQKMEEKSEYTFIKNGWGEHIIEDVLMLLSIQDETINFLISILK